MNPENRLSIKAAKSIAWVALEKWSSRLLSLLVFIILGRLLSPADFGLAALALSIATVLAVFVDAGLAQALVQREAIEEEDAHSAFWTAIGLSILIYALLILSSPFLALIFDQPSLTKIIPVSGLVLILSALSNVPAALLEREMKFSTLALRQLIGALFGAAAAISAALHGAGVWALVIQPVVSSCVATIVLWRASQWRPRLRYSSASARKLGIFGAQVLAIEFLNVMQSNIDKFIIGANFSASTLGNYFVAQRILTIIIDMLSTTFSKISFTTFSRLQTDPARMMRYFLFLTFAGCAIATPIFSALLAFGEEIISFLFKGRWSDSVPLMMLMIPSALLASVTAFDKNIFLAGGRGMMSLKLAAAQLTFGTLALFVAVPYGITALAATRSIRQIAFWPVRIFILKKYADLPVRKYLMQFFPSVVGACFFVAIAYALKSSLRLDNSVSPLVFLIVGLTLTLSVYTLVIVALAKNHIAAMVDLLKIFKTAKKSKAAE